MAAAFAPHARAAYDAPVSPNASPEVVALHGFIGDLRGKYILSGQQEFPQDWTTPIEIGGSNDVDFKRILDVTGKVPAVRGFDFLFYTYSEGGRNTQRSTERAIQWHQMGGIVTFACHMFMDIGSPAGNPQFYSPGASGAIGTTFDIRQAVISGTPENIELLAKFDHIAVQLKRLRDAGVPVLWRPFHECDGGWFWWGNKGAAPFKAAYRLMFQRFTEVHELNNLLWVYNPTENSTALATWYPGDDVVDMISLDVYPTAGTHPVYSAAYQQQYALRDGRKLVGMSENGGIPDPDTLFALGAYWSYFCTWNGSFIQDGITNPAPYLQRVFSHPRVLTLDELAPIMPRTGIAPSIVIPPKPATAGAGADVTLSVVARGSAPLAYQWRKNGADISGATSAALTLPDATAADAASYSVVVSNPTASSETTPVAVVINEAAHVSPPTALVNLSTRARVGTDTSIMISGFVVGGSGAKRLLVRAVGPTLGTAPYNVTGTIPDPQLVLTTQAEGTVLARNDDWSTGQDAVLLAQESARVGAFSLPAGSRDAALIITLPPGGYTALVSGVADQTGVALVEIYDLDAGAPARLVNLSTRADVGEGDNVLIAGFVTEGTGGTDILIRAAGPALAPAGITDPLADPRIALTLTNGSPVAENQDWGLAPNLAQLTSFATTAGAFSFVSGSKDAALLETIPTGARTAIVSGPAGTRGIALAEIYIAP